MDQGFRENRRQVERRTTGEQGDLAALLGGIDRPRYTGETGKIPFGLDTQIVQPGFQRVGLQFFGIAFPVRSQSADLTAWRVIAQQFPRVCIERQIGGEPDECADIEPVNAGTTDKTFRTVVLPFDLEIARVDAHRLDTAIRPPLGSAGVKGHALPLHGKPGYGKTHLQAPGHVRQVQRRQIVGQLQAHVLQGHIGRRFT